MKKYVFQLTEDIRDNKYPHGGSIDLDDDESFEDFFANIDSIPAQEILNGTLLSELTEINAAKFPPIEKLDKVHLQILVTSLERLFESWKIVLIIPASLPNRLKYPLYLQLFDVKVNGQEFLKYEFCNKNLSDCPFTSEYCICKANQRIMDIKSREMEEYIPVIFDYIDNIPQLLNHSEKFELKIGFPEQDSEYKSLREWFQMPPEVYIFSQHYERSQYMKVINKSLSIWNLDKNFRKWFRSHDIFDRYLMLSELLNLYAFYSDGCFYIGEILPELYHSYNSLGSLYIFALEELVEDE